MEAERKGAEMAVLVADLQRMRATTARDAVSRRIMGGMGEQVTTSPYIFNIFCTRRRRPR